MTRNLVLVFLAAGVLCACATADTQWAARSDADLAADLAECRAEAYAVDLRSTNAHADPRYDTAAAVARQIDRTTVRGLKIDDVYRALRDSCMTGRGWVEASPSP